VNRLTVAALASGVVLIAAFQAAAGDVFATGVVASEYGYHSEAEASLHDSRIELDVETGQVRVGLVFRVYEPSDPDYPGALDLPSAEFRQRFAEFTKESFSVRAGDFFVTFGRGLALRSYEEVELEHDTSLDGVLVDLSSGPISLQGLSGSVNEEISSSRVREHLVRGIRAKTTVAGWVDVAASAVGRTSQLVDEQVELPDEIAHFEDRVLGLETSAWVGPVSLGAEYVGRTGENPYAAGSDLEGHGTYVSATLDLPWATVFGELKDYEDLGHYLANPPTCVREHLWTLMNRVTYEIDLDDERGFLGEVSVPVGDVIYLTGGASEARTHDGDLSHWEIFSHADHMFSEVLHGSVAASLSREYLGNEYNDFTEHLSGAVELVVTPGSGQPVELVIEGQRTEEFYGSEHTDYLMSMTTYPGDGMTFSVLAETTDDEFSERDVWASFEIRAEVAADIEASFMMGTERGGKKCTGGVCYTEPEFEGVRVRLTGYF
jgi:hypothetical protein